MPSIRVENISKRYGTLTALDGVSFEVERGELFGFIGPDGAGKTTLFRLLTTLMLPTEVAPPSTGSMSSQTISPSVR